MLKIKNSNGEELIRINDNGETEIFDAKLKEQMQKEEQQETKGEE